MLEVDCSVLTPHSVFKTSGHVDRFSDWMCKDPKSGDIFRADHFVEDILENRLKGDKQARQVAPVEEKAKDAKREKKKIKGQVEAVKLDDAVAKEYEEVLAKIDNYDGQALGELIRKYDLRVPSSGELPTEPVAFNLMFQTSIGPNSNLPGYLRPETAQGQFLNFGKSKMQSITCQGVTDGSNKPNSSTSTRARCPLPLHPLASLTAMRFLPEPVSYACESSSWPRLSTLSTPRVAKHTAASRRSRTLRWTFSIAIPSCPAPPRSGR